MVHIIKVKLKIIYQMEKEKNIIKMEKLNMKVISLMVNLKKMENIYLMMVNIMKDNGKMD